MTFTDAIKTCFSKAFDFDGRASRTEYWFWVLFIVLCNLGLSILDGMIGENNLLAGDLALMNLIYIALTFLPGLAVTIRRLHDTGRTGWWWFIGLVPIVGWIVMLVFTLEEGKAGANEYGAEPEEHRRFRLGLEGSAGA